MDVADLFQLAPKRRLLPCSLAPPSDATSYLQIVPGDRSQACPHKPTSDTPDRCTALSGRLLVKYEHAVLANRSYLELIQGTISATHPSHERRLRALPDAPRVLVAGALGMNSSPARYPDVEICLSNDPAENHPLQKDVLLAAHGRRTLSHKAFATEVHCARQRHRRY